MNDNKKKNCGEWNELRVSGNLLKGKKIIKQLTNTTRPSSSSYSLIYYHYNYY